MCVNQAQKHPPRGAIVKISKWLCPGHMGGAQCTLEEEEEKVIKNVIKGLASKQNPSPASFQKQGQDPT